MRGINEDEQALMTHVTMWGSDGYPVRKCGRKWTWDYRSLKCPVLYRTKREAVASFEAYWDILLDAKAGRI